MSYSGLRETLAAAGYAKVLVSLKASEDATAATFAPPARRLPRADTDAFERALMNFFIIPSQAQSENLAAAAARSASRRFRRAEPLSTRRMRVYPHLRLATGYVDVSGAAALAANSRVRSVELAPELSLIRPVDARPAKSKKLTSWGIKRLEIERLWEAGYFGNGVVVGHLDTGVDGSHTALRGAIKAFAEFDMAGDRVPSAKPWDSGEHGTHTAGTIAGRPGPNGAFGAAPGAQLVSGMVIEGGQVIDRILAGMDWIVEERCRILSMSLGIRGFTPAFQTVIDALRAAGVLPVIAVGNEGPLTSRSPGNYANVISVGAIDEARRVADFSSSQRFNRESDPLVPDLVAPGVGVVSCIPGEAYAEMDGTSMATPHVAGLAALLLQAKFDATVDELECAIFASCRRPATAPEARANRGIPNAVLAFTLLTGGNLPVALARASVRRKQAASRKKSKTRADTGKRVAKRLAARR